MENRHRFNVEKHSLFGWVYYAEGSTERFPATSKQRAIDAAIDAAKVTVANGEAAQVHVRDSADGWRTAWPAQVVQSCNDLRGRKRTVSGRSQ